METAVETAIRIEPGHAVAGDPVDLGETAADEHLAIGLQRDQINRPRHSWIKTAVQTAVGIESGIPLRLVPFEGRKPTADEHFAIGLHDHRLNVVICANSSFARIETAVQTAIGIEPDNCVQVRASPNVPSPTTLCHRIARRQNK